MFSIISVCVEFVMMFSFFLNIYFIEVWLTYNV